MIRECTERDFDAIHEIINEASFAYRGAIPADCWHEPYMTREQLASEIAAGVRFAGWDDAGKLAGIMGLQTVRDATLIRHAYVRTSHQNKGIGKKLMAWLIAKTKGPLLVGTWAAATWAIAFYERNNFRLVSDAERDQLLATYWTIPDRQREVSVVLERRQP